MKLNYSPVQQEVWKSAWSSVHIFPKFFNSVQRPSWFPVWSSVWFPVQELVRFPVCNFVWYHASNSGLDFDEGETQ